MNKKSKLLLLLDRQKLTISGTNLTIPIVLDFPTSIVSDIDIIDFESFNLLLTNLIEASKIAPSEIILIVSPQAYYEKYTTISQIDSFLETIPFKNLVYKEYSLDNQPRLVAINKNFYEPIVKFFEKNNFNIIAIFPVFLLQFFQITLNTFNSKEIKNIYKKYKLLEPYSIISTQDIDKITTTTIHHPKEDNTRTYILLGIFCLLFVILLSYLSIGQYLYKLKLHKIQESNNTPSITPKPATNQIILIPTISYLPDNVLRIKIINSTGIPNQAATIKQSLTSFGFKQIDTSSGPVITATKNQIGFSQKVSPESRQKISEIVISKVGLLSEINLDETNDFDIIITTTSKPKQ